MNFLFLAILLATSCYSQVFQGKVNKIEFRPNGILLNDVPKLLRGGTLQWFRLPEEEWEDRIIKLKAMGGNLIDMYIAWRNHEPEEGSYDFTAFDPIKFLELAKKHGMYVYFRPGPYITNEMDAGGIPYWVRRKTTKKLLNATHSDGLINFRTEDYDWIHAFRGYFKRLNALIQPYLYTNGGNIILYAIENELNWFLDSIQNDKTARLPDGQPERDPDFNPDFRRYLLTIQQMVVEDDINVPVTACPGNGLLTAMYDIPEVHPFPNIYFTMDTTEYSVWNIKNLLREKSRLVKGLYTNTPVGITETCRENWVLRRMIIAGASLVSQFNIAGYYQSGRMNALGMYNDAFAGLTNDQLTKQFIKNGLKPEYLKWPGTGIVRFPLGMFQGVGDFNSPISPSGLIRDKFYGIRRTNMFIDAFESYLTLTSGTRRIALNGMPLLDSDYSVSVYNTTMLGSRDPDAKGTKVNYWMPLSNTKKSALLTLYNEGGEQSILLEENSINAFGNSFPKYSKLTVPFEHVQQLAQGPAKERSYSMFIPINFPLGSEGTLLYSTSEILTWSNLGDNRKVLVLQHQSGVMSEFSLDLAGYEFAEVSLSQSAYSLVLKERRNSTFTFTVLHSPLVQSFRFVKGSRILQVLIVDTLNAERMWKVPFKNSEILIFGADLILETSPGEFTLRQSKQDSVIQVFSDSPLRKLSDLVLTRPFDPITGITKFKFTKTLDFIVSISLDKGSLFEEEIPNDGQWIELGDTATPLEKNYIPGGHSFYRTTVDLTLKDLSKKNLLGQLVSPQFWVDSASDFVGIYINGQYITTLFPVGSEIDSYNFDRFYGFHIPHSVWKIGENQIVFKVEVWGCGSFMYSRGRTTRIPIGKLSIPVPGLKAAVPALGADNQKGLIGKGRVGSVPMKKWALQAKLPHEIEFSSANYTLDSSWNQGPSEWPWQLERGKIYWWSHSFHSNLLISQGTWAPIALEIKGKSSKATIWLNGKLIARWISDGEWIKNGNWLAPIRNLWLYTVPVDSFPISVNSLKDGENRLMIAFEEVSDTFKGVPGKIDSIRFTNAFEILDSQNIFNRQEFKQVPLRLE